MKCPFCGNEDTQVKTLGQLKIILLLEEEDFVPLVELVLQLSNEFN